MKAVWWLWLVGIQVVTALSLVILPEPLNYLYGGSFLSQEQVIYQSLLHGWHWGDGILHVSAPVQSPKWSLSGQGTYEKPLLLYNLENFWGRYNLISIFSLFCVA